MCVIEEKKEEEGRFHVLEIKCFFGWLAIRNMRNVKTRVGEILKLIRKVDALL